ncbi:unknown (plasmid) [Haloarcula marismortui ATCC 43049]|uniref:Uncharacterized protein n=1 Tax=Haloarcula marismortui (strain ATCC 43049 / DSM 3752 / JCM 8966 / VKM B-1809) TaxID=272569 RepID=Q5V819_HALMA|nr:unknown [Haloarcula marismortui ATCC 43049]
MGPTVPVGEKDRDARTIIPSGDTKATSKRSMLRRSIQPSSQRFTSDRS